MTHLELRPGASFTVEDLEAFERDGRRYELYDGALVVTPAPRPLHQRALIRLVIALANAAPPHLEVLPGPLDWLAGPSSLFEPDIVVAPPADFDRSPKRLETPPVLAVEILSPSTRVHDLGAKRLAYAAGGLSHYWVFDADAPSITTFELDAVRGVLVEVASAARDTELRVERPFAVTIRPQDLVRPGAGA